MEEKREFVALTYQTVKIKKSSALGRRVISVPRADLAFPGNPLAIWVIVVGGRGLILSSS